MAPIFFEGGLLLHSKLRLLISRGTSALVLGPLFGFCLDLPRAQAQSPLPDPMKVEALLFPNSVKPKQPLKLSVKLFLPRGYHAYADQFHLKLATESGFHLGDWKVAPLKTWYDKFSKKERQGLEGEGELTADLIAPEKIEGRELKIDLTYQACGETFCLFPFTKKISVPFEIAALQSHSSSSSSLWNLPELLKKSLSENIWLAFFLAFIAGILTSFTPCVYPMIPITLAVLTRGADHRKRSEQFLFSAIYVLGIATTFSGLGVAAAQFGFLFGSLLSQIWVLALVAALLFLMSLSLLGVFELTPPAFLMNKAGQKGRGGFLSAYLSGLFFGVVASPCVGPVLVSILAWVSTTRQPVLGFALLFVYALGLGVLFMGLGFFSRFLPRSGRWMIHVKKAMGLVVLGVSLYYGSLIWTQAQGPQTPSIDETKLSQNSLPWKALTEKALEEARLNGQPVIIDFWAVWCAACHELEQNTFSDPRVKKKSEEFVLLKYDATNVTPETEKWMEKFSIRGLPAVIFLSRDGVWLEKSTLNEYESPEPFLRRMSEVISR
jgi:thiol:disulfide interchange protein DsbD